MGLAACPESDDKAFSPDRLGFWFRGRAYELAPIGPEDPLRIAGQEGQAEQARSFDRERWVLGLSVAPLETPDDLVGFYALAHSGDPGRLDDTLIFVSPRMRGRDLSHLLIYGVYRELLRYPRPFCLCEVIDHPRLRLHARCGFAPPVRRVKDGKVEVGLFDLHAVLSRLESEDEIRPAG